MTQLPASFGRVFEDRDLIATAIGLELEDLVAELPVQPVSTGLPPTIVPIRDVETLRRAVRNDRAIGRAIRRSAGAELYLFAIDEAGGVVARMFEEGFDSARPGDWVAADMGVTSPNTVWPMPDL
jgi:predicted PhzF superfamily epimerase YddE/YHI9